MSFNYLFEMNILDQEVLHQLKGIDKQKYYLLQNNIVKDIKQDKEWLITIRQIQEQVLEKYKKQPECKKIIIDTFQLC